MANGRKDLNRMENTIGAANSDMKQPDASRYYKQIVKKDGEVKQKPISQKKYERKEEKSYDQLEKAIDNIGTGKSTRPKTIHTVENPSETQQLDIVKTLGKYPGAPAGKKTFVKSSAVIPEKPKKKDNKVYTASPFHTTYTPVGK